MNSVAHCVFNVCGCYSGSSSRPASAADPQTACHPTAAGRDRILQAAWQMLREGEELCPEEQRGKQRGCTGDGYTLGFQCWAVESHGEGVSAAFRAVCPQHTTGVAQRPLC